MRRCEYGNSYDSEGCEYWNISKIQVPSLFLKVAKGIVQPKFYKRWPQLCRVLRRSLLTTILDKFSGISVVIKFGIFHE